MELKTPEQIAAEQKFEAEKKAAVLQAKKDKAGVKHFVYGNRVFVPLLNRVVIPGIGRRTALELCADEEAQAYLVKENCIGSVIKEIE